MSFADDHKEALFEINAKNFENISLQVFKYQFEACDVYHQFCSSLNRTPENVQSLTEIPFLPVEFFKNHQVKSGVWKEEKIFKSSGTTATGRSQHYVKDPKFYQLVSKAIFEEVYGPIPNLQILALLPSYQEQKDSSLIEMVDYFMKSAKAGSRYFSDASRSELVKSLEDSTTKKLLIGVSFSLLDLAESYSSELSNLIVMETGGMKGRRKELTRAELHQILNDSFKQSATHSEYGMTELLSQAYGQDGLFKFPNWAKVLIRDINDPFSYPSGKTGGINIIDLANIDTCCFIETKDLGRKAGDRFEVLGRFDNSDVRGCNLLIQRN